MALDGDVNGGKKRKSISCGIHGTTVARFILKGCQAAEKHDALSCVVLYSGSVNLKSFM